MEEAAIRHNLTVRLNADERVETVPVKVYKLKRLTLFEPPTSARDLHLVDQSLEIPEEIEIQMDRLLKPPTPKGLRKTSSRRELAGSLL